jgi:hypothetical protein
MQNKKVIQYISITLTIAASFFAFWSVERAVCVPGASVWLAPSIWFSCFFIFFCINSVLVKNKKIIYSTIIFCLIFSLVFAFDFWQLLVILFGWFFLSAANARIRNDVECGKKIKPWRSMCFGKKYICLALALVISGQYYFLVKDWPAQKLIPSFNIDGVVGAITPKVLSAVIPALPASIDSEMTVDQFIVQMQKNQMDQIGYDSRELTKLSSDQRANIQKRINAEIDNNQNTLLVEGREKIADISGRPINGSEKLTNVFSELVNKKIRAVFNPGNISVDSLPIVTPVATLILFLTIISLSWFLAMILVPLAAGLFWILVRAKLVVISKIQTEAEMIE